VKVEAVDKLVSEAMDKRGWGWSPRMPSKRPMEQLRETSKSDMIVEDDTGKKRLLGVAEGDCRCSEQTDSVPVDRDTKEEKRERVLELGELEYWRLHAETIGDADGDTDVLMEFSGSSSCEIGRNSTLISPPIATFGLKTFGDAFGGDAAPKSDIAPADLPNKRGLHIRMRLNLSLTLIRPWSGEAAMARPPLPSAMGNRGSQPPRPKQKRL
jgi:hypothetical protein